VVVLGAVPGSGVTPGPRNRKGAVAFAPCERDDAASS
jgi:hypothetical protein